MDPTFDSPAIPSPARLASGATYPFTPFKVSEALCRAANEASRDKQRETPFMSKAIEGGYDFIGGKRDDISVLVALVDNI